MSYFLDAYKALKSIYSEGKYLSDAIQNIPNGEDKALTVRIVYGVVERDVTLNYYIGQLTKKPPKLAIKLVLKIGLYCLRFMHSLPPYSVCDNSVKLVKAIGKGSLSGFINATLKSSIDYQFEMPKNEAERLSIETSTPLWITKKIIKQYKEDYLKILGHNPTTKTHVRLNTLKWNRLQFDEYFSGCEKSDVGGAYVKVDDEIKGLFKSGKITYQSPQSMKIASLCVGFGDKVLDVCSAPGGKSVYISETLNQTVTCFDVHEHRVELIKKYAERMGAKVEAQVHDATVFLPRYSELFDVVLADVPCSGIGVRYSKPDVLLNREEKDISDLSKLQQEILETSSRYVKVGGILVYSTCTIFNEENERVISRFLDEHPEFSIYGEVMKVTPGVNGDEGFFAVRIRRNL